MKNKNEGTCGYGPGGKLGKTPGGTKGMPPDKRTNDMLTLREFIKEYINELVSISKDDEDAAEKAAELDKKGVDTKIEGR
jgi:hypothetical protein